VLNNWAVCVDGCSIFRQLAREFGHGTVARASARAWPLITLTVGVMVNGSATQSYALTVGLLPRVHVRANESRRLTLILTHLVVESAASDSENLCAPTKIVAGRCQDPLDVKSLDFVQGQKLFGIIRLIQLRRIRSA